MNTARHNPNPTTGRSAGLRRLIAACVVALAATIGLSGAAVRAATLTAADIVFVVDESQSTTAAQFDWIADAAAAIETKFAAEGFTSVQFGLVGFGSFMVHYDNVHTYGVKSVGGGDFGTAAQLATTFATPGVMVHSGVNEDGYLGIEAALGLFSRPDAARLVVLVTDEGRDPLTDPEHASPLSFDAILDAITDAGAVLNVVADLGGVTAGLKTLTDQDAIALTGNAGGADTAYVADGSGGFTTSIGGTATGLTDVIDPYVDLAWATNGAVFDLELTTSADAMLVASITAALAHIKHLETNNPDPPPSPPDVPEPTALWIGLTPLVLVRRRRRRTGK